MSRGNSHTKASAGQRIRGNVTYAKPGIHKGSKFVKKAGTWIEYTNFNTKGRTDKQEYK